MARIDLFLKGDIELQQELQDLPAKLENKILRKAIRESMKPVLNDARANVSTYRVTGKHTDKIRKGLKIRALKRRRGRLGVGIITPPREAIGIDPADKWYYPAHIELGTKKTPPHPFLRDALNSNKDSILEDLRNRIRAGLQSLTQG